ncbi:unnamed protein product [Acanthoscelides obtectus]|nr:unnamed protein product [Acanthoscelides obtectus]CAK1675000.1 Aminoacyl tRNA synthase complex-interacting multifunctional protein 1 [Acanthoscelides obtectus]
MINASLRSLNIYQNILNKIYRSARVLLKMPPQSALEQVKQNTKNAKQTIEELKNELRVINERYNALLAEQLRTENAALQLAVEQAKEKLIKLETQNGKKQIPVPNRNHETEQDVPEKVVDQAEPPKQHQPKEAKEKKERKEKKEKEVPVEAPVNVGRLDLKIGKIVEAKRHPDADSLYLLQIECGEERPRTVCSGLVKYVPIEELQDRVVILLCNLKPVKMRGVTSEAMVMCASSENGVEVLIPPPNSTPGEPVICKGYEGTPDRPFMNPKKKIFETVAPDLHTNDKLEACYKDSPFEVSGKGYCVAKTLKNVAVK